MITVDIDRELCLGSGHCALSVPAVFGLADDDGLGHVTVKTVPDDLADAVRRAAFTCPAAAIQLDGDQ
jgi:ferredoxin